MSRVSLLMRQVISEFCMWYSIYWAFARPNYNYSFHLYSHILETCLLCPVSLQASFLKKSPHSTSSVEATTVLIFNFNLRSGGWSPKWVHSARRPLTGLLYLPRRHFVHHKSHLTRPGIEPGPPRWEATD
jgi:hypothetical protein